MDLPIYSRTFEGWTSFLARLLMALPFLVGAAFKIPGTAPFAMEVNYSALAGVPLPFVAVTLALVIEAVAAIAIIVGWKVRPIAFLLAVYVLILTLIFHRNLSDQMEFGQFISHLSMIGGLLYMSVYGIQFKAVRPDPLPSTL